MTLTASDVVRRVLKSVPLIDGHNDVPWQLRNRFDNDIAACDFHDTSSLQPPMHVDITRLRSGLVGAQCMAAYVPIELAGPGAADVMFEQLAVATRLVEAYPEDLALARSADEVETIFQDGRVATLLAVEGGHGLENSIAHLEAAYAAGARYLTLVHNIHTDWADCCRVDPVHNGLTDEGREIVRRMNQLGMLVDLSHSSTKTMHDVLDVSPAPVACTHSGARAINDYPRNADDEILRRIAAGGGIAMATFVPYFVSAEVTQHEAAEQGEQARLAMLHPDEPERRAAALVEWKRTNPTPRATVAQVADHIDHMCEVMGFEHVGIGSDYDGIADVPDGLEDVSALPNLLEELAQRGYGETKLGAIAGGNFLRVLRAVEGAAS
ncbi:MAG: membrane dipeptidase [Acidobacteria bacterium]|nr:membrane dipeptidase [Acidobacteriota bacterium]